MEPAGDATRVESILAEVGHCRRLAAALLIGPGAADVDDVLQEASLAALSSNAPRGRGLRPWLTGVVRHLSIDAWRRQSRRTTHEQAAARREPSVPATSALHERMELHHALLRAVEELAEPYRSTIVRRWLDGATPQSIADADGLPLATVKTRLRRGLEQLRGRLRRDWGDDFARGLALLVPGGIAMSAKVNVTVAALLVAMFLGGATWLVVNRWGGGESSLPPIEEVADSRPGGGIETEGASGVAAQREVVSSTEPSADVVAVDPRRIAVLAGRVFDPSGTPAADAEVSAMTVGMSELPRPPVRGEREALPAVITRVRADRDGSFSFAGLRRGHRYCVIARGEGGGFARIDAAVAGASGDLELRLAPTTELRGVVSDGKESEGGRPVAGACVEVTRWSPDRADEHVTTSNAKGRFVLRGVPGASTFVMAVEGGRFSSFQRVQLDPGRTVGVVVPIGGAGLVEGIVVDAIDGHPIAGASLLLTVFMDIVAATTGEDGRFVLGSRTSWSRGIPHTIRARGYATAVRELSLPGKGDQQAVPVEVRLQPERFVTGRLVTRTGVPLAGVIVTAMPANRGARAVTHATVTADDGSFTIGELARVPHQLVVSGEGLDRLQLVFPFVEEEQARVDLGELRVGSGALLAGRIVDGEGAAIPFAQVVLRPAPPASVPPADPMAELGAAAAEASVDENDVADLSAASDGAGRFACAGLPAGRWRAWVTMRDAKRHALFEVALADEEVRDDVVWRVDSGLVVEGIVVDSDGAPVVNANLILIDTSKPPHSPHVRPIHYFDARTDEQGRFRFRRLGRPLFRLEVEPWPPRSIGGSRTLPRSIDHVAAGTRDLRVVLPEGGVIAGSVVDAKGAPAGEVWVCARDDSDVIIARAKVTPDGRFELLLDPDAVVRVEVRPFGSGLHAEREDLGVEPLAVAVDVVPDDEPLKLTLPPQ